MSMNIRTLNAGEPVPTPVEFRSGVAKLSGTLFHTARRPRAVVVLHGATGVPHGYYRHFATWLALERNIACLTYDYRDFGASARGPLKASKATMGDWGVHDQYAARLAAARMLPDVPIWVVGHSLGGLMLPFQPDPEQVARVITVASGPVHFRDHPWHFRPVAAALWYGAGPAATAMLGYLPGRVLRLGEDLPSGVFWQWRRWCTTPGFNAGDYGRALPLPDIRGVRAPVTFVAMADDQMVPPEAVWRLMPYYVEAPKRQVTIRPEDFGLGPIGHIGFFRRGNAPIWDRVLATEPGH
ncbi:MULTISPECIES: alpha/beta hydrolase family protein [Paracoccaceae]|jgi:predicted alpha/beta hydrolase|uniref:alpha/beta hydrolase family protein n=1 Tax=Rhodobacterales TaxID=204455 RepID=UPI001D0A620C|nr:alpha/beta fold hydrolase [Boseongicola sp. H5]